MRKIYLVGSLAQPRVREVAKALRDEGHEVFDDWHGCGPDIDTHWREYEQAKGNNFRDGIRGPLACHNFQFDLDHLHWTDTTVLVLPAGKSGHLELGYQIGRGIESHILLNGEPEKWDLMYRFAYLNSGGIWDNVKQLVERLKL